ncbi:MAG: ribosome maturation factor RimP [Microthrixaceae bacterium]
MSAQAERLGVLISPVLAELGLSLYDLDYSGGNLRVLLDRPGGIDLGAITQATRRISELLDDADIISSAYTLEVSSPGLERNLRTPAHFAGAIGREVKIKTRPSVEGERRVDGTLVASSETTCEVRSASGNSRVVDLIDIERARTHFVGDAAPKPGKGSRPGTVSKPKKNKQATKGANPAGVSRTKSAPESDN